MAQPVFITCMGGTGSSLLIKTLRGCGMRVGNDNTYFEERWRQSNCQHDLFTACAHMFKDEHLFDVKWRTRGLPDEWNRLHKDCPGSMRDKMIRILKSYVDEAERHDDAFGNPWEWFGLKDTRATDRLSKWREVVGIVKAVWGENTLLVTTVRDPVSYLHRLFKDERFLPTKGEHLIQYINACDVWKWMLDFEKNAHFVPYPHAFEDGSIKDICIKMGAGWTPEASAVYKPGQPTTVDQEIIDEFRDSFTLADDAILKYNRILTGIGREDCIVPMMK